MRAFIKNLIRLAGGSLVIGLVLLVIAFSMDNKVYSKWEGVNLDMGSVFLNHWDDDWDPTSDESINTENTEDAGLTSDADTDSAAEDTTVYQETYKDVKNLDFTIYAGKLHIEEGDSFSIEVNSANKVKIVSEVRDGTWRLREKSDDSADNGNKITVFGLNINLDKETNESNYTEVYITLPKDFSADNIKLSVGAGVLKAEKLTAKTGTITIGAGSSSIEEINIEQNAELKVEAGTLSIDGGSLHNSKITCSVGSVNIDGSITGESEISTTFGSINLNLEGKEKDYNYNVDCKLGTLTLNGTKYSGINKQITQKGSASNTMQLNCDMGSITMNID